jgi:hypothetical protein
MQLLGTEKGKKNKSKKREKREEQRQINNLKMRRDLIITTHIILMKLKFMKLSNSSVNMTQ